MKKVSNDTENKFKEGLKSYGNTDRVSETNDGNRVHQPSGPEEAAPNMTGGELLHGFLAELYRIPNAEFKEHLLSLCNKWNVRFRETRGK